MATHPHQSNSRRARDVLSPREPHWRADSVRGLGHAGGVPELQIAGDFDRGKTSRCKQLLALRPLWRNLERGSRTRRAEGLEPVAPVSPELVLELEELIAALDRRVPRVEQAGEAAIAREAATLRAKAVKRLEELVAQKTPARRKQTTAAAVTKR